MNVTVNKYKECSNEQLINSWLNGWICECSNKLIYFFFNITAWVITALCTLITSFIYFSNVPNAGVLLVTASLLQCSLGLFSKYRLEMLPPRWWRQRLGNDSVWLLWTGCSSEVVQDRWLEFWSCDCLICVIISFKFSTCSILTCYLVTFIFTWALIWRTVSQDFQQVLVLQNFALSFVYKLLSVSYFSK